MFAERTLYVTQKMPTLLRWQTELFTINLLSLPDVRLMVSNSTQIAASADRVAVTAQNLPGRISNEREEILKALQAQETSLKPLVGEVRETLTAGTQMSASLNTMLVTFDALMKRFGVGEPASGPPSTNSEPFRILDYAQTAGQMGAAARQLTDLLVTLDKTIGSTNLAQLSAQVGPVLVQAQSGGKELVNYIFLRAVLFVVIVLAALLIYRYVGARMSTAGRISTHSP
jgi:hypothetical protein